MSRSTSPCRLALEIRYSLHKRLLKGSMNKRKKVAWHKHLKKAKKQEEKQKAAGTNSR